MTLSGKQKQFALFYAACLNATEAAKLAGYKAKNEATYRAIGSENLTKPNIKAEIDRLLTEKTMQSHEVLSRLSEQATADLTDFFDINAMTGQPRLDLNKAVERGKMHLVKKITFGEFGFVKSIELHSSQAALVHVGKAYGLFKDVIEQNWKIELQKQGLNPSDVFEQLVQSIAENVPASTGSDDDGSDSGSAPAG